MLRDDLQAALDGRLQSLLTCVQSLTPFDQVKAEVSRIMEAYRRDSGDDQPLPDGKTLLNHNWKKAWKLSVFGIYGNPSNDRNDAALLAVFKALASIELDSDTKLLQNKHRAELEFSLCDFLNRRGIDTALSAKETERGNGPEEPNLFWWNGKASTFPTIQWRLLNFLWNEEGRRATQDDTMEAVWGHDNCRKEGALTSAMGRANEALLRADIPVELNERAGYVVLAIHSPAE